MQKVVAAVTLVGNFVVRSEDEQDWRVCPYAENKTACEGDFFWNELACQCFADYMCEIGCMPGTTLDPTNTCGDCVDSEELRAELYPEWATDEMIKMALEAGYAQKMEQPDDDTSHWPDCEVTPMCAADVVYNRLACECWPNPLNEKCGETYAKDRENPCEDLYEDPSDPCGECLDEESFLALFLEGIYVEDALLSIQKSIEHLTTDDDVSEPEFDDLGPECEPKTTCSRQDLSCVCEGEIKCEDRCGATNILGCSCHTMAEYKTFFLNGATDEEIEASLENTNDDNDSSPDGSPPTDEGENGDCGSEEDGGTVCVSPGIIKDDHAVKCISSAISAIAFAAILMH